MRTLFEILESTKEGERPSYEECYYSMLVLNSMLNMEVRRVRNLLGKDKEITESLKDFIITTQFNNYKSALNKPPKDYLGWENDPSNPEYQRRRDIGNKLFDKVLNKINLEKGKKDV